MGAIWTLGFARNRVFLGAEVLMCCAIQTAQVAVEWLHQGFSKGNCAAVLSCESDCVLQVTVGRIALELLHHRCDLNVRICTKHIETLCFLWVNGGSVAEKSWLACPAGAAILCFAVDSCLICARSGTEGSRWLFLFFVDAVLLCFACVETFCALELVH